MQKSIISHKKRKELNFLTITSALILTLLAISPAATSVSNLELSSSMEKGNVPDHISSETREKEGNKEKSRIRNIRIFTAIPILCITIAEIFIFSGRIGVAVWVHIGTLIALSPFQHVYKRL